MYKKTDLPCLPGYNFSDTIGKTDFPRVHHFDKIEENVYYLAEKPVSKINHSRYPALYAWGEELPAPPWLHMDGQRLMFKAYFQEAIDEGRFPYTVRMVNISFFLEDGTMKISEPAFDNSGLEQGILVRRQRIALPDPVKYRYFDILDLNVGTQVKIFGRDYVIYDCDRFTRRFLNRMGIPVPDPFQPLEDPSRAEKKLPVPKRCRKVPPSADFFKYDGMVLRFYGYWDDTDNENGIVHDLEILFFLSDGTMQILENDPVRCDIVKKKVLVKKCKIPKFFTHLEPVGFKDLPVLLNVIGDNIRKGYYVEDHNHQATCPTDYYEENDLTIGAQIDAFGRKIVITDLDEFTKEFYRKKYGIEDFTPAERPDDRGCQSNQRDWPIPPYNGYGTYEDSLTFCRSFLLKKPKYPYEKYYNYENQTNDIESQILRFGAKMISDVPYNSTRCFLICYYMFDRTIAVVEISCKSGARRCIPFQKRMTVLLPNENVYGSEKPKQFTAQDFYVGARVVLNGFEFAIEAADEYTLNFMEEHHSEFPQSNINLVMDKIKKKLDKFRREFVNNYAPLHSCNEKPVVTFSSLREAFKKYLCDCITEHEILTVARRYSLCQSKDLYPLEYLRALVHSDIIRDNWNGLDRLEEDMNEWDREKIGYMSKKELFTLLRASRVPIDKGIICLLLDRLCKNEDGKIRCQDVIKFLNLHSDPLPPAAPVKIIYWKPEEKPRDCQEIDWLSLAKDLGLYEEERD